MRQSTLPFKKSRSSDKRLKPLVFAGALGLGALSIWGCQNLWDNSAPTAVPPEPRRVYASSVKVYLQNVEKRTFYIGDFDRASCVAGFPQQWTIGFSSMLGLHHFDIDYGSGPNPGIDQVTVKAQQQGYTLKMGPIPVQLRNRNLCEESKVDDKVTFIEKGEDTEAFFQTLRTVAPDCQFKLVDGTESGLSCDLSVATPAELLTQLEALKRNMTTKWNHQPYLLIRRLTLATQMLEAMRSGEASPEVKKACRIIRYSLPNELPLSFRSKLWQDKVCQGKTADSQVLLLGLHQAVKELQTLSRRIEDASLVGLFSLAVPRDLNTAKEYTITLQPIDRPLVMSEIPPQITSCVWHPMFSDQAESQLVAIDLAQIQHSDRSFCDPSPALARAKREADVYVRSSMASEMEFQISNGQSKKLRLPTGDYRYSISQFTGPFPEELISAQEITPLSTGHLAWKSARPTLVIKNW